MAANNDVLLHAHRVLDDLFAEYSEQLGKARSGYEGHVRRVVELVGHQVDLDIERAGLLAVAGFFHDAAIWLDSTFDYLPPSIGRARQHLADTGASGGDADLVAAIIDEHHRLRPAKFDDPIVEAFRRADLTDVSFGLIGSPGTKRKLYRGLLKKYPSAGFRRGLVAVSLKWTLRHPFRPFPMIKL